MAVVAEAGGQRAAATSMRPAWKDMLSYYQNLANSYKTPKLFEYIFNPPVDHKLWNNSCGTRVSMALISAGVKGGIGHNIKIQRGEFSGKGIEPGATNLTDWLVKKWGQPDKKFNTTTSTTLKDLQVEIGNKNGVFAFLAANRREFGASGHITLWKGTNVVSGVKYPNEAYANGNPGRVFFWELK